MNQALKELGDYIAAAQPNEVVEAGLVSDELTVTTRPAGLVRLLTFLRDDSNCQFKVLVDVSGVDYPQREQRFDIVYNLLSLSQNQRMKVKVQTDEDTPVPTATGVFSSAGWYEREVWDLSLIHI